MGQRLTMIKRQRGLRKSNDPEAPLSLQEERFCAEYIYDCNGRRSVYAAGIKAKNDNVAGVRAHTLLQQPNVQKEIKRLQSDLSAVSGITRLKVLDEHAKIAFSNIAAYHNTWIERKLFDKLTQREKDCIQEIDTQTRTMPFGENGEEMTIEFIKVKLYDKQRALDSITKLLGFDEAQKVDITSGGLPLAPAQIAIFNSAPPLSFREEDVK